MGTTAHPAKKKYVRCNLCRKDVHFKGDGLAVGNHLMLWHKNEYRALNNESTDNPDYGAGSHIASSHATNNKAVEKTNNQTSKESQNKEWFASWEKARNTLNKVRKELKEESDEETKEDFKADIRRLRKRKAEFETLLGMDE